MRRSSDEAEDTSSAGADRAGLVMEGVSFAWRGRAVLQEVDLELAPGTVTGVRGLNGAGKTTLIRLLAGGLEPQAGRIALGDVAAADERREYLRRIGVASAGDRGLYARLDVRANLCLAAALALVPRAREHELVTATIERFALGALERRRVDRLSTGQRQRVRLAAAFLHEPKVVLLDEPTSGLDEDGTALLTAALAALITRGGCGLCSAPSGAEHGIAVDRMYVLSDGRLELQR